MSRSTAMLVLVAALGCGDDAATTVGDANLGLDAGVDAPTQACGQPRHRFAGDLCGPGAVACSVLRDEVVALDGHYRNDSPSIDVDATGEPRIFYNASELVSVGTYAVRGDGGTWSAETIPPASSTGALMIGAANDVRVLTRGDGFDASVWQRTEAGWLQTSSPPAIAAGALIGGWAASVVGDTAGCVHALGIATDDNARPSYYVDDGTAWQATILDEAPDLGFGQRPVLALAPGSGRPNALYWRQRNHDGFADFTLYWKAVGDAPVPIADYGYSLSGSQPDGIAITDAADGETRHALFTRVQPDLLGATAIVSYAAQAAGGAWQVHDLAVGDSSDLATYCGFPDPAQVGTTCAYSYTEYRSVALVASDSTARALYLKLLHDDVATLACDPLFPDVCGWRGPPVRTGELWMASVDDGTAQTVKLLDDVLPRGFGTHAIVDGDGRIHIALYQVPATGPELATTVRYLLLGPAAAAAADVR